MQKNYRLILVVALCITSTINMFGQDTATYKDVVLDGKPAKLNVTTGEITLINSKDTKEVKVAKVVKDVKVETVVAAKTEAMTNNLTVAESDFYVVQKGDNLLKLSERYNVSLRDLKNVNNLETTLIRPGQKLRVKNFDVESSETSEANLKGTSQHDYNVSNPDEHIVIKGETLYSLSKRYGMTVNELKQKNNLTSNLIKIGQMLNIGGYDQSSNVTNSTIWTVSKGDTLYSIAKKNNTTVDAIKQLNGLTSNLISIGQKLQLK